MSGLFGMFTTRNLESPQTPLTDAHLMDWAEGVPAASGEHVTETKAFGMPAVWRAIWVISSVAASLPLHTYRDETKQRTPNPLLKDPHPEMTAYEVWRLTYVHRCAWGNAYVQKVRDGSGRVRELWPTRPDRVRTGAVTPDSEYPWSKVFEVTDDKGRMHARSPREIMHIPGFGYDGVTGLSPIRAAREGIGLSLAAEKAGAKFFGQGAMLSGVLQTEQRLKQDQANALKRSWKQKLTGADNAYDVAILDSGAKFQPVTMPYKDAQFIESRRFQIPEAARMFGVPMFLMFETEKSTSWGTGLEQQATGWVQFDLGPAWLKPTEARITKELVLPERSDEYAEYTVEGLLRGDSKSRAEFYRVMREVGAYSANDIRRLENQPPVEGGDTYLQPLNMEPLGSESDDDGDPTSNTEDDDDDNDSDDND